MKLDSGRPQLLRVHWIRALLSAGSCSIYQSRRVKNAPVTFPPAT